MPDDDTKGARGSVPDVDPVIHAPARLAILGILKVAKVADFMFLQKQTGLSNGNLSTHLTKLEASGYVVIEKSFIGRTPHTLIRLTKTGREAIRKYHDQMRKALDDLLG